MVWSGVLSAREGEEYLGGLHVVCWISSVSEQFIIHKHVSCTCVMYIIVIAAVFLVFPDCGFSTVKDAANPWFLYVHAARDFLFCHGE